MSSVPSTLQLQILVINNDPAEIVTIQNQLTRDMRVPWRITSCETADDAQIMVSNADIIILKPEKEGLTRQEVFQDVQELVFETPIIVLANASSLGRGNGAETGFATYLMEQGAADIILRGQFARMVDAIEFAMIRQKISTGTRRDADDALAQSEKQNKTDAKADKSARLSEGERHKQIVRMFLGDYSTDQAH